MGRRANSQNTEERLASYLELHLRMRRHGRLLDIGGGLRDHEAHANVGLDRDLMQKLVNSQQIQGLTWLQIKGNKIDSDGVRTLTASEHLSSLTWLNMSRNPIGDDGAYALAASRHMANLTLLNLKDCNIGDEGAKALAESPHLRALTWLNLSKNEIGLAGARFLAESPYLDGRIRLNLDENRTGLPYESLIDLEALRRHFRLLAALERVPGRKVRCMLVGAPRAGKTTLLRLMTETSPDWGKLARTHGIEQQTIPLLAVARRFENETRDLDLQLWDCGGQSLQGMLHGLFFRRCPLFLLVLRSASCLDTVPAWLDMIVSQQDSGAKPTVLPIFNSVGSDRQKLLEGLGAVDRAYCALIDFAPRVEMEIGPDADNAAMLNRLLGRIREPLETLHIEDLLKPLIGLGDLVSELPEPQYSLQEFIRVVRSEPLFAATVSIIQEALVRDGRGETLSDGTMLSNLLYFLEHEGRLTTFLFDQREDGELADRDGSVIISPEWIRRGLYALLPPEDDDPLHAGSANSRFARQLRTNGEDGLPGRFRRRDLGPVWTGCDIPITEHARILDVLCKHEVGLVIPVNDRHDRHYFVPAYLDSAQDNHASVGALIRQALRNSAHTEIFEVDLQLANGHRIWPHHFFYRAMVWLAAAPLRLKSIARTRGEFSRPFQLSGVGRNRMTLTHTDEPGVVIRIYLHEQRMWCLVEDRRAGDEAEIPRDVASLVDELAAALDDALRVSATRTRLNRILPCPGCLTHIWRDLPAGGDDAVTAALRSVHTWLVQDVLRRSREDLLRCEKDRHVTTPAKLLDMVLSKKRGAGGRSAPPPDYNEAKHSAVSIALFLYMSGMARMSGSGAKVPALASKGQFEASRDNNLSTMDVNTLRAWIAGNGGTNRLEVFCRHLLEKFDVVRWLADCGASSFESEATDLRLICEANRNLLADPQAAMTFWANAHPQTQRQLPSAWPKKLDRSLTITDFLETIVPRETGVLGKQV